MLLLAIAGHAAAQNFPQAFPNLCGTFGDMNVCTNQAAQSTQETIELTGITSGTYMMQQKVYNSSSCDTTTLIQTLFAQGTWQDLGPLTVGAQVSSLFAGKREYRPLVRHGAPTPLSPPPISPHCSLVVGGCRSASISLPTAPV
jgi:hypothetical protein